MASLSGVTLSNELKQSFSHAKSSNTVRYIKIGIADGHWVEVSTGNRVSFQWEKDIDLTQKVLEEKVPCCFIFFKNNKDTLLMSYMPENTSAKEKMVYSSSKAALKELLGKDFEDYFGTSKSDFTHEAFEKRKSVQAPLSYVEEQLRELPKQLDAEDGKKSAGFGLLAALGKGVPPHGLKSVPKPE